MAVDSRIVAERKRSNIFWSSILDIEFVIS